MQYRKLGKTNERVSVLGFGCMRLPLLPGGDNTMIDELETGRMIRYAIEKGVNYIDTAYPYHGESMKSAGQSEPVLGRILQDGLREKVKIATKLPSWLIQSHGDMDRFLNEQLERLQTGRVDFYMAHALNKERWQHLKQCGITKFLDRALGDGRIRYAGFSYHDRQEHFREIADGYDWSFAQIQYNYMDENFQAGKEGLHYAADKGMGIIVMEPLRGGKLARNLPGEITEVFADTGKSPARWALDWVWDHADVSLLLSGMSTMDQVAENIASAEKATEESFDAEALALIEKVRRLFRQKIRVDCTSCDYCMPCPNGVNIPGCFEHYNNYHMYGREEAYYMLKPAQRASACINCGDCEPLCPQSLPIPELMKEVVAAFEA